MLGKTGQHPHSIQPSKSSRPEFGLIDPDRTLSNPPYPIHPHPYPYPSLPTQISPVHYKFVLYHIIQNQSNRSKPRRALTRRPASSHHMPTPNGTPHDDSIQIGPNRYWPTSHDPDLTEPPQALPCHRIVPAQITPVLAGPDPANIIPAKPILAGPVPPITTQSIPQRSLPFHPDTIPIDLSMANH